MHGMATVGNVNIVISEKIVGLLLLHPQVDVRTNWLLRNLSLDGQLCLRDSKNAASLKVHHLSPLPASM